MNARVLELIQRPENISAEDISFLQSEIDKFPYMQSIRTLHLSAIHQFNTENYHRELTKTAAYTTDKKILYHFINFKKVSYHCITCVTFLTQTSLRFVRVAQNLLRLQ